MYSLYSQVIVKVGGKSCSSHGHSDSCGHALTLETKFGDEIYCLVLQDERVSKLRNKKRNIHLESVI